MTLHELWDDLMPPERRWLGVLVFFSLIIHAAFFFVFQVQPYALDGFPRRPAQVSWLTGRAQSANSDGLWLSWKDPTVIALPRAPLPPLQSFSALPDLPGRFEELPQLSAQLNDSSLQIHQTDLGYKAKEELRTASTKPMPVKVETPPLPSGTEVEFLGGLTSREVRLRKELPKPEVTSALRATILTLGVDAQGNVAVATVEESSSDSAVDQQAVNILKQWKFKALEKADGDMVWGKALVYWDLQPKPQPEQ